MDKVYLTLNGNKIIIYQVKGQSNLYGIEINGSFGGYYDTTGEFTGYFRLTTEDINIIESEIKKKVHN